MWCLRRRRLAEVEGGDAFGVVVDADGRESRARVLEGQRQADVALADHADVRGVRRDTRVQSLTPATAAGLFVAYSALNGVTLSMIMLAYTGASVATTFVVTGGMFGALAFFGTTTTRSLAGAGQFFFMGLIGLVLASIVGMFWHNDALQFLITVIGVIVFTGLTAWDAQRLKQMAATVPEERVGSYAVVGALALYLNFINLFLMLLTVLGGRRD